MRLCLINVKGPEEVLNAELHSCVWHAHYLISKSLSIKRDFCVSQVVGRLRDDVEVISTISRQVDKS